MTRKKTKFCLSWPNKTLKISGRLRNIGILLAERTITPYWNSILQLSSLFYRMWRHFSLDDLDTQKVPGVVECSPRPWVNQIIYFQIFILFGRCLLLLVRTLSAHHASHGLSAHALDLTLTQSTALPSARLKLKQGYIWMLCRVALWAQMVKQRINSEV